jgi:CheY-like chemotaxis protein
VMSGSFDLEDYERCDSLGATPVEKGSAFWQQLREALVDSLPGNEREAISRDESWDDLKQIPSTPRILIIDADPRPADLLTSRLKKFGIEVLTAADALRGFQVARNEMPSMIVAADHLPDWDVEHLLWKLRGSPRTRQLPVFVMAETFSKSSQDNLKRDVAGAAGLGGNSPLRLYEVREGLQGRFRDMMLDPLGVRFRRLGRHAERAQNVDHKPVTNAHALGQRFALLGEEHTAIRPRGREPGALETRDRLDRGGVRNAEAPGNVGRPRFA